MPAKRFINTWTIRRTLWRALPPSSGENPPVRGTNWNAVLVSPSKSLPANRWRIETTRTAEKQITRLASPAQKAIERLLRERLANGDDPRQ